MLAGAPKSLVAVCNQPVIESVNSVLLCVECIGRETAFSHHVVPVLSECTRLVFSGLVFSRLVFSVVPVLSECTGLVFSGLVFSGSSVPTLYRLLGALSVGLKSTGLPCPALPCPTRPCPVQRWSPARAPGNRRLLGVSNSKATFHCQLEGK